MKVAFLAAMLVTEKNAPFSYAFTIKGKLNYAPGVADADFEL